MQHRSACQKETRRISNREVCISGQGVMAIFISDDRARKLAERLAWLQRTTVDEAVRHALERALADDRAERERRIRESLARVDAMPRYDFDENDMYDESGAPK